MFHSFHVMVNDALIQTEQGEKIGEQFVPMDNFLGEVLPRCGKHETALLFVFQESFCVESLNHVSNAGLRDS